MIQLVPRTHPERAAEESVDVPVPQNMEVVLEVSRRGTICGRPEPGAVLFLFHPSGGRGASRVF